MLGGAAGSSHSPVHVYERVVSIATRLRAEKLKSSNPGRREFSHLKRVDTVSGAHPASNAMDTGVLCREVKRPESDDYSPQSNAEVNE
jgi:hypothetical protein